MNTTSTKKVYIILSQSGSGISRFLKFFTKQEYNHVSISIYRDLHEMYSFGRRYAYYPFWSGLVAESKDRGTFKRFSEAKAIVLSADITVDTYNQIYFDINDMMSRNTKYGYNYIGAIMSFFNKNHKLRNRYYCTEFVKEILTRSRFSASEKLSEVSLPIHFLQIPEFKCIFKGKFADYQ